VQVVAKTNGSSNGKDRGTRVGSPGTGLNLDSDLA
jgi:hypothetical protein